MAGKTKVVLRSFVQEGIERFTKCDLFLLTYSTYRGLDKIFLYAYIAECVAKKKTQLKQSTPAGMGNFQFTKCYN